MRILITGGSGFIGSRLITHLRNHHELTILSRNPNRALQKLGFDLHALSSLDQLENLDAYDAVINLAGEPISQRWSELSRQRITHSRWDTTAKLVALWHRSATPPSTFISGSAIGYYGRQDGQKIDEQFDQPHPEFTHTVCARWEELALQLQSIARVCILRTGVVLGSGGGALAKMVPPFRLGLGGPIGDGSQYMSWIHIDDTVKAIRFLLEHPNVSGIFNLTAPHPVTNRQFAAALGKALKRPAEMRMPGWLLKLMMGEMSELVLYGQRVVPQRLLAAGFRFSHPHIDEALHQIFRPHAKPRKD